jgi:dephospho-CoA kinase
MIIGISGKIGSGKDIVGKIIQYLVANRTEPNCIPKLVTFEECLEVWDNEEKHNPNCGTTWIIKKFAYKLKQIVSILISIPIEDLEKEEVKNIVLGREWLKFFVGDNEPKPYTIRELLQKVGTEAMRDTVHKDIWVNALMCDYKVQHKGTTYKGNSMIVDMQNKDYDFPNWVITDVRFPNEAKAVKDRDGIMIRVNRITDFQLAMEKTALGAEIAMNKIREHPSETALDDYEFDYTIDNNATIEELVEKVKEILIKEKLL